jgi:hypothetical protein
MAGANWVRFEKAHLFRVGEGEGEGVKKFFENNPKQSRLFVNQKALPIV